MTYAERMATYKNAIGEGTVVRLRSGGPDMTAEKWRNDDIVTVTWFDGFECRRDAFHPFALVVL